MDTLSQRIRQGDRDRGEDARLMFVDLSCNAIDGVCAGARHQADVYATHQGVGVRVRPGRARGRQTAFRFGGCFATVQPSRWRAR